MILESPAHTMPARRTRLRILPACATLVALASAAVVCLGPGSGSSQDGQGEAARARGVQTSEEHPPEPFAGLFSLGSIHLEPGAVIDSSDSPIDGFLHGLTQGRAGAQVRSIGPISLEHRPGNPPTVIVGQAHPAPGSEVHIAKGCFVTGSIAPYSDGTLLPSLPEFQTLEDSDLNLTTGQLFTEQGQVHYRQVRLTNHATWILRGPLDLRVRKLEVLDQAKLILDASQGPIVLHVADSFVMGPATELQGDSINQGRVLILVGQGQANSQGPIERNGNQKRNRAQAMRDRLAGKDARTPSQLSQELRFKWRGRGQFFGMLYAPFSKVALSKNLRFQGLITAASIRLEAGAHLTCDTRALQAWTFANLSTPPPTKRRP